MRQSTIIYITIVAFLIVVTLSITLFQHGKEDKELYQEPEPDTGGMLDKSFRTNLYKNGIQPCSALASDMNVVSDNMIDTFRFRQWVPSINNPAYADIEKSKKADPNLEFCYFFMDSNNVIYSNNPAEQIAPAMDPLATFSNCDMSNKLFKDFSFVKDMHIDTSYDTSHTLPYNKCVLTIDKSRISDANLKKFWNSMNDSEKGYTFCKGFVNIVMDEVQKYTEAVNRLHQKLVPYRAQFATTSNLKARIDDLTTTNAYLEGTEIKNMLATLDTLQTMISQSNDSSSSNIAILDGDVNKLRSQNQELYSIYQKLSTTNQQLKTDYEREYASYNFVNNMSKACQRMYQELTSQYNKQVEINNQRRNTYSELETRFNKCIREYTAMQDMHKKEQERNKELIPKYQDIRNKLIVCVSEKNALIQEEAKLRDRLEKMISDLKTCDAQRADYKAQVEVLTKQNQALYDEIEDIKRRCRNQQAAYEMKKVDAKQEAVKSIAQAQQQVCAAAISIRDKKLQLLSEVSEMNARLTEAKATASNCDALTAKCGCYQLVDSIGWNDHGRDGQWIITTGGRMAGIKDAKKKAEKDGGQAYIRFRCGDGSISEFFTYEDWEDKQKNRIKVAGNDVAILNNCRIEVAYVYKRMK